MVAFLINIVLSLCDFTNPAFSTTELNLANQLQKKALLKLVLDSFIFLSQLTTYNHHPVAESEAKTGVSYPVHPDGHSHQ